MRNYDNLRKILEVSNENFSNENFSKFSYETFRSQIIFVKKWFHETRR